jgi:oligopeptide/dipeptide ABC transporter ATP-binding protein
MQVVFQDPYASLDPRMSVADLLEEPLQIHRLGSGEERRRRVGEIIELVGLAKTQLNKKPHAFSGGQRQRIAIARALVLEPELVVLDEPISSLDVSAQAQIVNLLRDLQEQLGISYLFISHDLAVTEYFCDTIAVLYHGRVLEQGPRSAIFTNPLHPYTVELLAAVPVPDPDQPLRPAARPDAGRAPGTSSPGCVFQARCPIGHNRPLCGSDRPPLAPSEEGHLVACHFLVEAAAYRRETLNPEPAGARQPS